MKDWIVKNDGTVVLKYEEGDVIVRKEDFNRAFGTMINSLREDIIRDFAIK